MSSANQNKLQARVIKAAEEALARQGYVRAIDILTGISWLDHSALKSWRQGQLPCLENGIQTNLARISQAMQLLREWAAQSQLDASETDYVAKTPARATLRFSKSGDATIERHYRTHWVSPKLSEKERERIKESVNRPPELVVVRPQNDEWKCHRCGGAGELLIMEEPGPSCLACAGLSKLVFLPAGDAGLSRRAKAKSELHAVVVRFSRARKRYERQGLLVEPDALREAESEMKESTPKNR